jgi:2-polyprenyl-3-methyl-5-hydroxy-6-metoxy-1,4-benzoquinol methylase
MKDKSEGQIGRVSLQYVRPKKGAHTYSEDATEKKLLKLFQAKDSKARVQRILESRNLDWSMYYHLSPLRGGSVSWYNFDKGSRVLEVGAGCGAVTEALVKKSIELTSIDLSERRSVINAYRNSTSKNLDIVIGNLQDYRPRKRFDYIVCVGVLEYAGSFIDSSDPYKKLLTIFTGLLKQKGKLLLAIENRFGLKYWTGSREDHTGGFFDGIHSYPQEKRVQTFTKSELSTLLKQSGFEKQSFYYAFPDYKHPRVIYSDEYFPGNGTEFPLGLLPTPPTDTGRLNIVNEQLAMTHIESEKLYRSLANSFIVSAERIV